MSMVRVLSGHLSVSVSWACDAVLMTELGRGPSLLRVPRASKLTRSGGQRWARPPLALCPPLRTPRNGGGPHTHRQGLKGVWGRCGQMFPVKGPVDVTCLWNACLCRSCCLCKSCPQPE